MRRLRRIFTAPVRPIGTRTVPPRPPVTTGALVDVRWPHSPACTYGGCRG